MLLNRMTPRRSLTRLHLRTASYPNSNGPSRRRRSWSGSTLVPHPARADADLVTRLDLLVMPLLILGFFSLQLDRGNMYVAQGAGQTRD